MKSLLNNSKDVLKIYNVGSKYNLNVISLVKKIAEHFPKNQIKINIKNSSIKEIYSQKLNYKKISKELEWEPKINLDEGLKKTIKWYKKFHHKKI